jgi:hypothetical protein
MKALNKFQLNPQRIMNNDELLRLNGGNMQACTCLCVNHVTYEWEGYLVSASGDCNADCTSAFQVDSWGECGNA